MMKHRIEQVNEEMRYQLGEILTRDIEVPSDFFITITAVKTSADLRAATMFFTVLPEQQEEAAVTFLKRHLRDIRVELGRRVRMKFTPRLLFSLDTGAVKARRIES
ncbi:MAG: 30S ribosome-binding factor RbfA, partial [Patescibacteria group bacterium]